MGRTNYKTARLSLKTHETLKTFAKKKHMKITELFNVIAFAIERGKIEIDGTIIEVK